LDEISNGSPTPPLKFLSEVDPHMGDADFLRTYDAGFSNNGHIAPKSPPRMVSLVFTNLALGSVFLHADLS